MRKLALVAILAMVAWLGVAGDASACCCWGCGWSCGSPCCTPCCWRSCYSCCYSPCCNDYYGPCCIYYPCYSPPGTIVSPYGYAGVYYASGHAMGSAKATVVVTLPADATLTANGQLTKTASERRVFVTPELDNGKTFSYVLRMTVERDGKTVEETKKVLVKAGEETKVSFDAPAVATASK